MGEQDHALHEIADARARMSELADELALHAKPEHVKEIAAEKVSEWKERAKELAAEKAVELKEQAKEAVVEKASEIKTHAKEAVMQKTMELKERVDTPRGWSFLGAIIGACAGAALMKKAFQVREERSFGTGSDELRYRGERYSTDVSAGIGMGSDMGTSGGVGLKEHTSEMAHSVKEKAHDLKERAMDAGTELKGRATHWFDRALESQPLMLALGSAALGVFASLILPVSNRERQLIEPAKRKAQESISHLGEQLEHKLQGQEMGSLGNIGSSEGLMGAERPGFVDANTLGAPTSSRIPPVPPLDDLSTKIH